MNVSTNTDYNILILHWYYFFYFSNVCVAMIVYKINQKNKPQTRRKTQHATPGSDALPSDLWTESFVICETIVRFTKFVASIFFNCNCNSKSPITRRTSLKSLCFVAPDVILPPTIGLKLNQLSAEFSSIVNSRLILFIWKRLFQVAGNTFPLNYLDAITSLSTPNLLDGYVAEHNI